MSIDSGITVGELWNRIEERIDKLDEKFDAKFEALRMTSTTFATKKDIGALGDRVGKVEERLVDLEEDKSDRNAWSKVKSKSIGFWQTLIYPVVTLIAGAIYFTAGKH